MLNDLDRTYLRYATDPDRLDNLLAAARRYAARQAERDGHPSAEDAAQEIVVKVWKSLSRFQRRSSFRSFVHTIAIHHLLDEARAAKSRIVVETVDDQMPEPDAPRADAIRFSLEPFMDDDKVILVALAKHPHFDKAAKDLKISSRHCGPHWNKSRQENERLDKRRPNPQT
jgi:RNA polymerase sigma factor (sigma-70 family)